MRTQVTRTFGTLGWPGFSTKTGTPFAARYLVAYSVSTPITRPSCSSSVNLRSHRCGRCQNTRQRQSRIPTGESTLLLKLPDFSQGLSPHILQIVSLLFVEQLPWCRSVSLAVNFKNPVDEPAKHTNRSACDSETISVNLRYPPIHHTTTQRAV